MKTSLLAAGVAMALAGQAFGQAPAAPTVVKHAVTTTSTTTTGLTAKQATSKACSDQANAKGLHGKDRKKFRSACKDGKPKA